MSQIHYRCGECQGTNFPEGMFVYVCPLCKTYIHPGCWDSHAKHHADPQGDVSLEPLIPRRGKIGAYGIIQWDS